MKTIYLLLLPALLLIGSAKAQSLDLKWSEKMQYDNFKDGFFNEFIGSSNDLVYGLYNNLALRKKKAEKQMKLIAFNKTTMQKVSEVVLKGKKDKSRNEKLKGMHYHSSKVIKDQVYVFWTKATKGDVDVYAEIYDAQLSLVNNLEKVYSASSKAVKNITAPVVQIRVPSKNIEDILIGAEISQGKGEKVEFDYKLMDLGLVEVSKGNVTLPIVQSSKYAGTSASFEYGSDGNLYIKSYIRMSKEERKKAPKGEHSSYSVLNVVDVLSNDLETFEMKYDGLNVFNFNVVSDDKGVRLYGFFNDMEKDPSGRRTHGIFYATLRGGQMSEPNFSYFDKKTLTELFKDDAEDKKSTSTSTKKKKSKSKAKAKDDEALDYYYTIEVAELLGNDEIVLFCSKLYNYAVTTCTSSPNGGQTCTTNYYCSKSNVTAFKLNNAGEILWASNVDRQKTYSGWDIYDLKVVSEDNKFYVIYGSSFDLNAEKKNRKSSKSRKEVRDNFEYAVFDADNGKNKKQEVIVNTGATAKKERKTVDPTKIQVIDNRYYINSSRVTMKPGLTAVGCAASIVCFPVMYYVFLSGDMRKGTGYLGTIDMNSKKKK